MNFFGKSSTQEEKARTVLNETSASKLGSGSEVDRYESHFAEGTDRMKKAALNYQGVGAEQDRYGAHFSLDQAKVWAAAQNILNAKGSGAEQDRHASHFGLGADGIARARAIANAQGVGAEQDRYASHFGGLHKEQVQKAAESIHDTVKDAAGKK